MSTKKVKEAGANQKVKVTRSASFAEHFFNHAQFGMTVFDIYAYLSDVHHDVDGVLWRDQKCRIVMSPIEAVLVQRFLANTIKAYEAQYGKIPLPDSLKDEGYES